MRVNLLNAALHYANEWMFWKHMDYALIVSIQTVKFHCHVYGSFNNAPENGQIPTRIPSNTLNECERTANFMEMLTNFNENSKISTLLRGNNINQRKNVSYQ